MKYRHFIVRCFFLLSALGAALPVLAQESLQVTLLMSPRPSTKLSEWRSNRETVRLTILNITGKTVEAKVDARISLAGTLAAWTKIEAMPLVTLPPGQTILFAGDIIPENAVNFTGEIKQSSVRAGILPEGNYEICVKLVQPPTKEVLSNSDCRSFYLTQYQLPNLILPENGKAFANGNEKLTLFTWTPVIPAPQTPVNYRLRVVELLPGQNPKQAFSTNLPLFERKTLGQTTFMWPQEVPVPSTGGTFAWSVQPEDNDGNPMVSPEGFTPPFTFSILPQRDDCTALAEKVGTEKETAQRLEEDYWSAYNRYERLSKELDDAEDRADVYIIERVKTEVGDAKADLTMKKNNYESAYTRYDNALAAYNNCAKK